jgi:FSR family fosmidomycin resistance protein-like MFS transporter
MAELTAVTGVAAAEKTAFRVLAALSFCHLLNDMIQSLLPAIYPLLKSSYGLSFGQVGLLTSTFQITASLLQPIVGSYTDRKPRPHSLAAGMCLTLLGLILLSLANSFALLLVAAAFVGSGSSVFHPESSRVARAASGGQHGLAQSVFQVGGNAGSAIGPLLAAFIVLPRGQSSVAWFSIAALVAVLLLARVGRWYKSTALPAAKARAARPPESAALPRRTVITTIAVLLALIFSKYFYLASLTSYYTFYLIGRFHVSVQNAEVHLFIFLASVAAGTIAGGPIGDRIGRKFVIWASILGVLPFTLLLPHANLFWTGVLTVPIGMILASAFPTIVVYAQELLPGKVGAVAGLFFGFAFGMAGIGAAVLGKLADATGLDFVYAVCAFLPAIGLLAVFLPNLHRGRHLRPQAAQLK